MARTKAAAAKAAERAKLQNIDEIVITIRASEGNLQRLWALLAFADLPNVELVTAAPTLLPYEEPGATPPQLEINRNAVANAVMPLLERYVATHGQDAAKKMVASFGAERLGKLTDTQLLDLYHALAEGAGE